MTAHKVSQPCLCKSPAGKERQDTRQESLLLPPSSGAMSKEAFSELSPGPLGSFCNAAPNSRILFWKATKKPPCYYRGCQWQQPQAAPTWGSSAQPMRLLWQVSLPACCPSLLPPWLRRPALLAEQWRVISGAAAPDPVYK